MKRTAEEVVAHPLWMMPVFLLLIISFIQGIHTTAHWRMQIDANAYCRNNAEWIEMNQEEKEDW